MDATMSRNLDQLPLELLDEVLHQFDNVNDVLSLCLVSKKLHAVAAPRLFDLVPIALVLPGRLENLPETLRAAPLPTTRLRRARRLELWPDRWNPGRDRCYHSRLQRTENVEDGADDAAAEPSVDHDSNIPTKEELSHEVADQLLHYLQEVRDNNLMHFGWELGTCIPDDIMGPNGWLTRSHKDIESISLVTAGPCHCNIPKPDEPSSTISLSQFKNLKSLTWIGLMSPSEAEEAALAIDLNATHLEHLELDCIDANAHIIHNFDVDTGADFLFSTPQSPPAESFRFAALRQLSLSKIDLGNHLVIAFDWEKLSGLTIRYCIGAGAFLTELTEANKTLGLKTFDFRSHPWHPEGGALDRFLGSFSGLENVSLHVECEFHSSGDFILRTLARKHHRTLKTLAYEMRRWHGTVLNDRPEPLRNMGIADLATLAEMRRDNPLARLEQLESLGLAVRVDLLKTILPPLAGNSGFKILHVRMPEYLRQAQGGVEETFRVTHAGFASPTDTATYCAAHPSNFFKFVSWVFSHEGFPSVELLAYGDFSSGVDQDAGFFIRRRARLPEEPQGPPWDFYSRLGSGGDRVKSLDTLIRKNAEFFRSVPTGDLMKIR